jgi:hypothetical protein
MRGNSEWISCMVQLGPGGTAERLAERRPAHVDDGRRPIDVLVRISLLDHANCVPCRGDSKQDSGERREGRNRSRSWKGDHHGCGGWVGVRRKQDSPSPLCRDSNASATPIVRSSASRATPQTAALCAKDRTWSLGRATPASANRRRAPARDCRAHAHGRRSRDRRAPG